MEKVKPSKNKSPKNAPNPQDESLFCMQASEDVLAKDWLNEKDAQWDAV